MSETTLNIPLIRKIMEHIESAPSEWEQDSWYRSMPADVPAALTAAVEKEQIVETSDLAFCGSTGCFAGHALLLSGKATLIVSKETDTFDPSYAYYNVTMVDRETGAEFDNTILEEARDVLGPTYEQANEIFYSYPGTPEAMRAHVESVIGERL